MSAALEKIDPSGDVLPAIIDDFVRRAESAAKIPQARAKDRVVSARVNRKNSQPQLLEL